MMPASAIAFYVISGFLLVTALLSVTGKQIFRSAIWLLFSLLGVAAIYFWLDLNLLAAIQIVVYVGGIVVLIIFSVFLTRGAGEELPIIKNKRRFFSLLAVLLGFLFSAWCLWSYGFTNVAIDTPMADVKTIGRQMLSVGPGGYALPFEMVSILLLSAMVACIAIAMKLPESDQTSNKK
jgi:NADH-quinone oxidoreductase subunit J